MVGVGHTFHDRNGDGTVSASDVSLMLTTYGGVGAADQPPPAGHVRFAPELDLAPAGGGLAVSDAGGLQACFASTDGWCTALYDADTNGVVDLSDAARFSAYAALAQAPQALAQTTLAPTSLTQTSLTGTLAALAAPLAAPPAGGDQPPPDLTPLQSRFRNPFLWTGQRYDPTTKLYHFWARSYDPNTGRFLQEDMQGVKATVTTNFAQTGVNAIPELGLLVSAAEYANGCQLYIVVLDNPTNLIDPLGLEEHHLYPLHLGGPSSGPGIDMSHRRNIDFHNAVAKAMGLATAYGDNGRAAWIKKTPAQQRAILEAASAAIGIDVSTPAFQRALSDAMATAKPGVQQARGKVRLVQVTWIVDEAGDVVRTKGFGAADKLKGVSNAIPAVAGLLTGISLLSAIKDPHMRDMFEITLKYQRSGELSMIDEVFILHDLYQITNDPYASSFGWTLWRDMYIN